jgi:uncharacterized protein
MYQFEWDPQKRLVNLQKHHIDFAEAKSIFDGAIVTIEDDRFAYAEQRFVTFGLLQGRVIAVTHTERGHRIRLISARKATKYEQLTYFQQITD